MGSSCAERIAVVTGGSRGIGRAAAIRLASEGADLALVASDIDGVRFGRSLATTADEIEAMGRRVLAIGADLGDPAERQLIIDQVEAELGPVDILVNNAVMGIFANVAEFTPETLRAMQEVNVWAPWDLTRRVLPGMLERDRGWIVNLSSDVSENIRIGGAAYGGTKAMLNLLTWCLGLELAGTGVVANVVAPLGASLTEQLAVYVEAGVLTPESTEPVEAMAEAILALSTAPPGTLRDEVCRSLELLAELGLPVRDLVGERVLPGYSVEDLAGEITRLELEREKPIELRGHEGDPA
jgi:NAD(P)-dependent dehydrogenase (short-subunit alcohol dehydrogenase family)